MLGEPGDQVRFHALLGVSAACPGFEAKHCLCERNWKMSWLLWSQLFLFSVWFPVSKMATLIWGSF